MTRLRPLSYLVLGVGAVLLLQACKKDNNGIADLAGAPDLAPPPGDLSVIDQAVEQDMTPAPDLLPPPCSAEITSCAGLCGKVVDSCTGTVFQCGGCDGTQVCDLDTHTCIEPKVDCDDFGAECGQIKNSCGRRLNCGECSTGNECDPDTKQCGTCAAVTCEDLGFQCGMAWLGCGNPQVDTDLTDCGACPDDQVCNGAFHICEPTCTPPATTDEINTYCAAKKTERGVECGYITDGCGGLVFCGECGPGEKCGQRGVANRCEPDETPVECQALGKECGTLTSKCDAQVISCGDCPEGEVCNENGLCGPPCQPKICAELLADGAECGNFADDGCGAAVTCKCDGAKVCGADGKCTDLSDCSDYTTRMVGQPCSNGAAPAFPQGDGSNLTCTCNGAGLFCVNGTTIVSGATSGSCCQDTGAKCSGANGLGGVCKPVNSCTGQEGNSCCSGNTHCDTGTNTCVNSCSTHDATGAFGKPCSTTGRSYFDGATCGCNVGLVCVGETGSTPGTCRNNCGTFGANGNQGNPCSNGPSPSFPSMTTDPDFTCPCNGGRVCVTGTAPNYDIVTGGTAGTCQNLADVDPDNQVDCFARGGYWNGTSCCFNSTCAGNQCGIAIANACTTGVNSAGQSPPSSISCRDCGCGDYPTPDVVGDPCSTSTTNNLFETRTNPHSNAFLTCGCTNNLLCVNTASTGDPAGNGTCVVRKTCSDPNADGNTSDTRANNRNPGSGDQGKACNDNNVYDRGDGQKFSCKCGVAGGWDNAQCTGDTTTAEQSGSCTCAKKTECTSCGEDGGTDRCGGTMDCCANDKVCVNNGGNPVKCCTPYSCTNLPPSSPYNQSGGYCGVVDDGCQAPFNCGCSGGNVCNPSSHKCQPQNTCESLGKTKQIGSDCNDNNFYDRGDGVKFSCGCDKTNAPNNTCTGDSPSTEGKCTCVPKACGTELPCGPYTNDGCGNSGNCAC